MANSKWQIAPSRWFFYFIFFLFAISNWLFASSALAAFEWEVPLPPAPGGATLDETSLDSLFTYIYNFGLGLGGFFAFIRLIIAGIKWGSEGAGIPQKSAALDDIKNTIFGLLLLLFSWVILNTINPQILNLNLQISKAETNQTESSQGLAGVFDSLTRSAQRKSLDEVLQNVSKQYLIQVQPDKIRQLSLGNYQLEPVKFCPPTSSSDSVCAMDCTQANDPCDFYRDKCAGKTPEGWDPGCPLPADPDCSAGGVGSVCELVGDWKPDFKNKNCGYDESGLPPPRRGSGGFGAPDDYRTYLVEAANFFGIPPKVLFAIQVAESEGLLFDSYEGITPEYIAAAASPGGYIGLANPQNPELANNENWCLPNSSGAVGPMQQPIKSCAISGAAKTRCIWDTYCKFRNAANQIRNSRGYKPNPSNIRDAYAIAAKRLKFLMDDGKGGEFDGWLNDFLGYGYGFSACPKRGEMLKWDPPTINPIVFYVMGHWYYGDCVSPYTGIARLRNGEELTINTNSYLPWAAQNAEKIRKVRDVFVAYAQSAGLLPDNFEIVEEVTTPTYCDFIWWYYDTH
ncbi:MAG: pilin [Patescibacteria group bacterium]